MSFHILISLVRSQTKNALKKLEWVRENKDNAFGENLFVITRRKN